MPEHFLHVFKREPQEIAELVKRRTYIAASPGRSEGDAGVPARRRCNFLLRAGVEGMSFGMHSIANRHDLNAQAEPFIA
jgi:hypothetical protein